MTRSRTMAVVGVCALSAAAAVWLNARGAAPVVDASRTPGLLELVASLIVSARPTLPMATLFGVWHQIAVAAAAGFSALAVILLTRSLTAGTAIGLVAAASPALLPSLAPPDVTAVAVAAATMSAIFAGNAYGAAAGLLIGTAIAPPLILPNIVLSACLAFGPAKQRVLRGLAGAMLLVIVPAALVVALPALPGEPATAALRASVRWPAASGAGRQILIGLVSTAGPLALALAAYGIYGLSFGAMKAMKPAGYVRTVLAIGLPASAAVAAFVPGAEPVRVLAPLMVAVWLLAGAGIAEVIGGSGTKASRTAGIAVAMVFAAVHLAPRIDPPPSAAERPARLGHGSLTRQAFQTLVYELPSGASLVDDDAATAVLLRSLRGKLERSRKSLSIVGRTPEDVATARRASRVFALPRAQTELQDRGVRFADVNPPIPALAEIAGVIPCETLTTGWRSMPSAAGAVRLAFVADTDAARGPIVVYTGAPAAIEASAVGWPPLAMRGFYTRSYDRAQPDRRQGLADEVANDEAPSGDAAVNAAYVARTELWRVPGAPRALTFALSSPSTAVAATQLPRGTGPIRLCASFPSPVRPFR